MNKSIRNLFVLFMLLFGVFIAHEPTYAAGNGSQKTSLETKEEDAIDIEDADISPVGENILKNPSFEKEENASAPKDWEVSASQNKGTITSNLTVKKEENSSVQVWSCSKVDKPNYVAATQVVPVMKESKYTLSGFLKSNLSPDGKAHLNVEQLDKNKEPIASRRRWRSNRNRALTGKVNHWTKRKLEIRTGGNTSFLRVYLKVEQSKKGSEGSAWFTDMSLERVNEKKTEHVFNGKGPAENLLTNSRFERRQKKSSTFPAGWERYEVGDKGKIRLNSRVKCSGIRSVQLIPSSTKEGLGCIALTQVVPVDQEQAYTVSGFIRTNQLTDANAFLNAEQLDQQKRPVHAHRWKDNRYSKLIGTQGWTKRQVTVTTSPTTCFLRVYLEVDHTKQPTSGSAWFDHIQLERGSVSSSYNLVENGSFEVEDESTNGLSHWYVSSGDSAIDSDVSVNQGKSLKFHRRKTTEPLKQISQVIPINQAKPAPITITGMVQGQDLDNHMEQVPNIWLGIVYDGIAQDGDYHVPNQGVKAPLDDYDWQQISSTIHPTKPIKQVNLYVRIGENNTGTVWFDDIRVQQGNAVTTYEYDETTTKITEPMGNIYEVKREGNTLRCTNGKGKTFQYTYNEWDQLKTVEAPGDIKVRYTYDDRGNIIKKRATSKNGRQLYNQQSYEYTEDNQLKTIVDPLGHRTTYNYEGQGEGLKTRIQYADNTTIQYTYDEYGRTTKEIFDGTLRYKHTYVGDNQVHILDTVTGKIKKITFDQENRVQKVCIDGKAIHWQYSEDGNLLSQTIQEGRSSYTHSYQYNEEEQNTVIIHPDGGESHFDYDEEGRVIIIGVPNDTSGSFDYDDNGRVTKVNLLTHDGSTIAKYTYEYDANNNRTKVVDHHGTTIRYTYDDLDQLLSETDPLTGNTIHYTYDAVGNRTSKIIRDPKGKHLFTVKYVHNEANQLVKVQNQPFTYDIHGNLIQDDQKRYIWDNAGRLVEIKNKKGTKTIATFLYDEEGRRIQSRIYGKETNYVYDGDSIDVLYETNHKKEITCYYTRTATGQLLSMKKASGEVYYYHYNAHEDVVAITDQNHQKVATYVYDAWGNILDQQGPFAKENPYRYVGYRYDEAIGLYYLTARYYNPRTGTFLSLDPAPGELEDIHTQNGYCYVGNNPVMQADPSGEVFWFAVNAAFAAYDGYQAYKAGKGWGEIAATTALGFVGGGRMKAGSKLLKGVATKAASKVQKGVGKFKNLFSKGPKAKALPRSVKRVAAKPKGNYAKKPPVRKYAVTKKRISNVTTAQRATKKVPVKRNVQPGGGKTSGGKSRGQNTKPGSKPQKKVEGKASTPGKKHDVVVQKFQRKLTENEREALQKFLFNARKQNSLRSVKWKREGKIKTLNANQQAVLRKLENVIRNNLKEHDFAGVAKELKGVRTGFDHIKEMKQSRIALEKVKRSLEGSLKNPRLTKCMRQQLEEALKTTKKYLDRILKTLRGDL